MKSVQLTREGDPDVLTCSDATQPTPAAGEVLIKLTYASLNHLDLWIRKGMPAVPKPRIMGADGCGTVEAVGDGVTATWIGEEVLLDPCVTCGECPQCIAGDTVFCPRFSVLGEHRAGTHAEYICVPTRNVHVVPAHLDSVHAAALPLVFATAWRMLMTRAQLKQGDLVLVWGATSGVGTAAIQIASAVGAQVIATTRRLDTTDVLYELGATDVVNTASESVADDILVASDGRLVDVVFDHLGEVAWAPSMKVMARGGRFVTCGATTGAMPPAQITRIFWKQLSILGSTMATTQEFADMLAFVTEHEIRPRVHRVFQLAEIADAHEYMEHAQQIGKIVLRIGA